MIFVWRSEDKVSFAIMVVILRSVVVVIALDLVWISDVMTLAEVSQGRLLHTMFCDGFTMSNAYVDLLVIFFIHVCIWWCSHLHVHVLCNLKICVYAVYMYYIVQGVNFYHVRQMNFAYIKFTMYHWIIMPTHLLNQVHFFGLCDPTVVVQCPTYDAIGYC